MSVLRLPYVHISFDIHLVLHFLFNFRRRHLPSFISYFHWTIHFLFVHFVCLCIQLSGKHRDAERARVQSIEHTFYDFVDQFFLCRLSVAAYYLCTPIFTVYMPFIVRPLGDKCLIWTNEKINKSQWKRWVTVIRPISLCGARRRRRRTSSPIEIELGTTA